MIISSPGVPWRAWDSHRGQISWIHQWLRPIFKWSPPPSSNILHIFIQKSKDGCRQQQGSLMQSRCLPPQIEPISDLDSGCVQPNFVGNPVSYPLHLALILCVSFFTSTPQPSTMVFLTLCGNRLQI